MRIWKKSFLKEICKEVRIQKGHPRWRSGRKPACQCRRCKRCGFHPWVATCSSILAWKIPWTKESRGLQYMGWQRVRHDWATKHSTAHIVCGITPLGNGKSQKRSLEQQFSLSDLPLKPCRNPVCCPEPGASGDLVACTRFRGFLLFILAHRAVRSRKYSPWG